MLPHLLSSYLKNCFIHCTKSFPGSNLFWVSAKVVAIKDTFDNDEKKGQNKFTMPKSLWITHLIPKWFSIWADELLKTHWRAYNLSINRKRRICWWNISFARWIVRSGNCLYIWCVFSCLRRSCKAPSLLIMSPEDFLWTSFHCFLKL